MSGIVWGCAFFFNEILDCDGVFLLLRDSIHAPMISRGNFLSLHKGLANCRWWPILGQHSNLWCRSHYISALHEALIVSILVLSIHLGWWLVIILFLASSCCFVVPIAIVQFDLSAEVRRVNLPVWHWQLFVLLRPDHLLLIQRILHQVLILGGWLEKGDILAVVGVWLDLQWEGRNDVELVLQGRALLLLYLHLFDRR